MLRSFLCVAETRSVTETARRMGRTQPAITLQIAKLEEVVGRKLFRDDTRRPTLTNDGDYRVEVRARQPGTPRRGIRAEVGAATRRFASPRRC